MKSKCLTCQYVDFVPNTRTFKNVTVNVIDVYSRKHGKKIFKSPKHSRYIGCVVRNPKGEEKGLSFALDGNPEKTIITLSMETLYIIANFMRDFESGLIFANEGDLDLL